MADSAQRDLATPILAELALRAAVASRLRSESERRLLDSILEAAVALFRAEAASIALVAGDRLEFVTAAGEHAAGVVGRSIPIGEGIGGYVVQTGDPIAIADPIKDPRFRRSTAAQTGFLPDSILAVPLKTPDAVVGVIEILDCRDGAFSSTDLTLAAVFARQAAVAIEAARVEREFPILVAKVLKAYDLSPTPELADAIAQLAGERDDDFWQFVDDVSEMAQASPEMRHFIEELLPLARRRLTASRGRSRHS